MPRLSIVPFVLVPVCLVAFAAGAVDIDGDGVPDATDNCQDVSNDQLDSDLDGYGNPCDGDIDGDGVVAHSDIALLRARLGCASSDPLCWGDQAEAADLDGDGLVDRPDLMQLARLLGSPPGPSGLPCAGIAPCTPAGPKAMLPVVSVAESAPYDQVYDQKDIDAALVACGSGCNLLFLARTYEDVALDIGSFPDGFAMYGYGEGVTTLRSPLFGDDDWDYTIFVSENAPDGVIIRDMSLDGRKTEQTPVLAEDGTLDMDVAGRGSGIVTGNPEVANRRSGGRIEHVEIAHYVSIGIMMWHSPEWIVRDNWIHHMGCHQVDEPCGPLWDAVVDDSDVPGRKSRGFGINVSNNSDGTLIEYNAVQGATKSGIQVFAAEKLDCSDSRPSRDLLIGSNAVRSSGAGYTINGGCAITLLDNLAEGMRVTGAEDSKIASGFVCARNGDGSQWVGNVSRENQGSGFLLDCEGGDLDFVDNTSIDNCQGIRVPVADLSFKGPVAAAEDWARGLVIQNYRSVGSSSCEYGLRLQRRRDVRVTGGAMEGGSLRGIWIRGATDVEVEGVSVTSASPSGDTGVVFDHREPLSQVFVQASTEVLGFEAEVSIKGSAEGGGATYCRLEDPLPPGCQP